MENTYIIGEKPLLISDIQTIIEEGFTLALSDSAKKKITECRRHLDQTVADSDAPIYGINTGFGSLYNIAIEKDQLAQLQENLVMSHACGTGDEVPTEVVKIMILLKIQSLSYGHSGVTIETVEYLVHFFNYGVFPVIYQQGSLGASGDLAPLAHLSLALLGKGDVYFNDEKVPAFEALEAIGLKPHVLQSKEGLALLNGTQFMGSYAVWCLIQSVKLSYMADLIGAVSLEGYDGRIEPFDALIHQVRPHAGQIKTAENIREFLEGSEMISRHKTHVQDPYSFRCMPQVHGASKDTISYAIKVVTTEINSVTDNPTIFGEEGKIISAGNFHGQPLALVLDFLAIALSELGSISERRTYQLISGRRELPPFLVAKPGLNSGFMIPQYTAASIASQNKQLCTPASADSIESSNGQEDHVSMGANAATKLYRVVENLERILAIELLNGSQALGFREEKSSEFIETFVAQYREEVSFVERDRILHNDIEASISFIQSTSLDPELIY